MKLQRFPDFPGFFREISYLDYMVSSPPLIKRGLTAKMMEFKGGTSFDHQMQGGTNQEGQMFKCIGKGDTFVKKILSLEKKPV